MMTSNEAYNLLRLNGTCTDVVAQETISLIQRDAYEAGLLKATELCNKLELEFNNSQSTWCEASACRDCINSIEKVIYNETNS